jgi:hypothetical protein
LTALSSGADQCFCECACEVPSNVRTDVRATVFFSGLQLARNQPRGTGNWNKRHAAAGGAWCCPAPSAPAIQLDPSTFVDHYEAALVDLLKKKQAGIAPKTTPAVVPERRVINLMDALKKSIEAETPKKPAAGQAKTRRRAAAPSKRA